MIYLDNAATSLPKAPGVAERWSTPSNRPWATRAGPPRSPLAASRIAFEAREELASFLGVPDSRRLAFTKNATEALNLVIMGAVPPGGLIAVSSLEHNSVMRPARRLEASEASSSWCSPATAGKPDPKSLAAALAASPRPPRPDRGEQRHRGDPPFEEVAASAAPPARPSSWTGARRPAISRSHWRHSALRPSASRATRASSALRARADWLGQGFDPHPSSRAARAATRPLELQPRALPDRYEAGTQNAPALAGLLGPCASSPGRARGVERREAALRERLVGRPRGNPEPDGSSAPPRGEQRAGVSMAARGLSPGELALELGRRAASRPARPPLRPLGPRGPRHPESGAGPSGSRRDSSRPNRRSTKP